MATIGNAPSGQKGTLDGTEKLPIDGSKYALISAIAAYIRTLAQTLTNKTISLASNTLTGTKTEFNSAVSDGDIAYEAFKTISVSGQSDVVADSATDTLTLAAGSNVTITTNATTDTITIASSGGGGGSISFASYKNNGTGNTANASGGSVDPINLDTEVVDANSIGSLGSNVVTVAGSGYYLISLQLQVITASALTAAGSFTIELNTTAADIYTIVPVPNGTNYTDGVFFLQGLVNLSAGNTVGASFVNNTNKNIDVWIFELTLLKLS